MRCLNILPNHVCHLAGDVGDDAHAGVGRSSTRHYSECDLPSLCAHAASRAEDRRHARTQGIASEEVGEKVMLEPAAIKRLVKSGEVADLVLYLCSGSACSITGAD